ncbi:MAG: hypothetical protein QNJ74_11010 [Trichodesmium sp. MO_231.B1]|nr:hypothetical protein [Trichodesmium sp. MO_231.B1]
MKKEYYKSLIKCENFIYDPGNMNIYREIVGMRLPLDRGKKRSASGAFRQDGMARFPALTEPLRSTPYPIDQESGRQAEYSVRMGWRGFPLLQSRSEVRHIQSPLEKKKFFIISQSYPFSRRGNY